MSVFNDFQRLWMQRFPQSSLSDAWEQDVRASLDRHRNKISELSKELEQETLYVEYLERLLSDVENFREIGSDSTELFEAASGGIASMTEPSAGTTNNSSNDATSSSCGGVGIHTIAAEALMKSSLNLLEGGSVVGDNNKDKTNRLSLNTDNKYTTLSSPSGTTTLNSGIASRTVGATNTKRRNGESYEKEDKDIGTEKDATRNEKNGALQQCITELAASINSKRSEQKELARENQQPSQSQKLSGGEISHFVTVIEVKESKDKESEDTLIQQSSSENSTSTFSSFEQKSGGGNKIEPTAPPLSPALTSNSPSMSASSYQAHQDAKKKMPPRPPPKNIRRVEPPTIPGGGQLSSSPKRDTPFAGSAMPLPSSFGSYKSPSSSLESNVKPLDVLRQKSNENQIDIKSSSSIRKTNSEMFKYGNTPELMEELGQKVGRFESMEKAKRAENLNSLTAAAGNSSSVVTSSLGRTSSSAQSRATTSGRSSIGHVSASPNGSLTKNTKLIGPDSSSTGSLENKSCNSLQTTDAEIGNGHQQQRTAGSKESLASQGISEVIKSYESISSLSSDSAKAPQHVDNEPYYDTVPLDNGEGEYVIIKPGCTGSSSSRDDLSVPGSTLPIGSTAHLSSQASVADPESPGRTSNYVNIDYFIQQSNETRSSSLDSDGEYEGPPILRTISHDENSTQTPSVLRKVSGNARGVKIRTILSGIIQSETIYVKCLNKMREYKKAIHATLGTSQPVIKEDEEHTIFFKIEELYEVHTAFVADLKATVAHEGGDVLIGETFKRLADMFDLYSAFLHNYGQAIETVKKCSANNPQFKQIVSEIVVNLQTEQTLPLEDLLHKPVARVQINALVFNDLLRETPPNHPDHQPLRKAQNTIQMFLNQFNVVNQRLPGESNKNLRRVVRNSFIVELVDGHRKLRHLFLFNDVIACAKHKALSRERIEHELKWFIPLRDVIIFDETESNSELKESSPANILQVKRNLRAVRDQVIHEEKDEKARKSNGIRSGEKYRRKLSDLESQLMLASPSLVFRIGNRTNNKTITFFLSSEFERTQWIDSINSLKQTCNLSGANTINSLDVTAFIVAMQKGMKIEMGSYLMRKPNDDPLFVGDLYVTIQGLSGMEQPSDLYISVEVDSYGHYFYGATTKIICRSATPVWNETFVIELEGTQNVRILLYEAQKRPFLRAKQVIKLSRSWLQEQSTQTRDIKLSDTLELGIKLRYVPGELCLATSKPGALFGVKMSQVLKREKRDIPFIISACIREVERRGMLEVGIYRVSGSALDLAKLKKSFESDAYEAEQLLKEVDIHSVTGILKSYLRELPEALYSDLLYPRFFETFSAFSNNNEGARINELLKVFEELPAANKLSINHILDHLISYKNHPGCFLCIFSNSAGKNTQETPRMVLVTDSRRVHEKESENKMSLHNLAMVFGPTLLRPGQTQVKQKDPLAASTVDVMAQAGILYSFLQARTKRE